MGKNGRRNAFGWAETTVKKISLQYPDTKLYALLCLQPSGNLEDKLWMSRLMRATDWKFYSNQYHYTFQRNSLQSFPVFHAKRPHNKKIAILIRNLSANGSLRLLSYENNACCRIGKPNAKMLPNQLSLFETEPEELISTEEEEYQNYNPYDIERWNETAAYLERLSCPLTNFQWLMPVNYYNCEYLRPFLFHLERIPDLRYRFLSHELIPDTGLLYEIKHCEEELSEQVYPNKRPAKSNCYK